jgi:hypothetical protein
MDPTVRHLGIDEDRLAIIMLRGVGEERRFKSDAPVGRDDGEDRPE